MPESTIERIAGLMHDLFDEYDGPITRATTARDIEQWDSLAHVQLLVMVEQAFKVRFASREIESLKCLGDLVDSVERRKASVP